MPLFSQKDSQRNELASNSSAISSHSRRVKLASLAAAKSGEIWRRCVEANEAVTVERSPWKETSGTLLVVAVDAHRDYLSIHVSQAVAHRVGRSFIDQQPSHHSLIAYKTTQAMSLAHILVPALLLFTLCGAQIIADMMPSDVINQYGASKHNNQDGPVFRPNFYFDSVKQPSQDAVDNLLFKLKRERGRRTFDEEY